MSEAGSVAQSSSTAGSAALPSPANAEAVRRQLRRILASPDFHASDRIRRFLEYVVEEALGGRSPQIKAYTIAIAVFGRQPDFDNTTDPIVRIEAGRLRHSLDHYYLKAGRDDPIRIEIPRGGYAPRFNPRIAADHPTPGQTRTGVRPVTWRLVLACCLAIVTLIAATGAALWIGYRSGIQRGDTLPFEEAGHGPGVLVLSLVEREADPDQRYFAIGVTEDIVDKLARFGGLRVYSAATAATELKALPDADAFLAERKVGYVLNGTLARDDGEVRVITQLTDAGTGRVIWSGSYYGALDTGRIFRLQDVIAGEIAAALGQPYGVIPAAEAAGDHYSLPAYDCVLQAYAYYRAISVERHALVRRCLEAAVRDDPDHAQPWAMLAQIYLDEDRYRFNPRASGQDARDRALDAARRAAALAPNSDLAQEALLVVHFHRGEFDAFRTAAERALELNPNNPEILANVGQRLAALGSWDRGLRLVRQAQYLSPDPPGLYRLTVALGAYLEGEYEAALDEASRMDLPDMLLAQMLVTAIYGQLGRTVEAGAALVRLVEMDPDIATRAEDELARLHYRADTIGLWIDGLRRAGLPVAEQGLRRGPLP